MQEICQSTHNFQVVFFSNFSELNDQDSVENYFLMQNHVQSVSFIIAAIDPSELFRKLWNMIEHRTEQQFGMLNKTEK